MLNFVLGIVSVELWLQQHRAFVFYEPRRMSKWVLPIYFRNGRANNVGGLFQAEIIYMRAQYLAFSA